MATAPSCMGNSLGEICASRAMPSQMSDCPTVRGMMLQTTSCRVWALVTSQVASMPPRK